MVKFWGKTKEEEEAEEIALRPARIRNMSDPQLRGWLNSSLMEMGASYDRWAFSKGEAEEFTKLLNIINDLWNELQSRVSE